MITRVVIPTRLHTCLVIFWQTSSRECYPLQLKFLPKVKSMKSLRQIVKNGYLCEVFDKLAEQTFSTHLCNNKAYIVHNCYARVQLIYLLNERLDWEVFLSSSLPSESWLNPWQTTFPESLACLLLFFPIFLS